MEGFRPNSAVTKIVTAGLITIVALIVLPLIAKLMVNLVIGGITLAVLVFLGYNYRLVYSVFDSISWKLTKAYVSRNKVDVIRQYINLQVKKLNDIQNTAITVKGLATELERAIQVKKQELESNINKVKRYSANNGDKGLIDSLAVRISVDTDTLKRLEPEYQKLLQNSETLEKLYNFLRKNVETTRYKLDSHVQEYEVKKKVAEATGMINEFLKGNTQEAALYKESLKQLEQSTSLFTAQIMQFNTDHAASLSEQELNQTIDVLKGLEIVNGENVS